MAKKISAEGHCAAEVTMPGSHSIVILLCNPRDLRGPPSPPIICFTCYQVGDHIAPDCDMKVKDVSLVPHQYEKLTTAQKDRVSPDAYLRAVAFLSYEANRVINPVATIDPPPRLGTGPKGPPPSEGVRQPPKN